MSGIDLRQAKVRSGHFRLKGTAGETGLGHWDGIDCDRPARSRPGEGESWDGIDRDGARTMANAIPNEKRSPPTICWWWGSLRASREKNPHHQRRGLPGGRGPARTPFGQGRDASIGTGLIARTQVRPLRPPARRPVVARSHRQKTADLCPAPGSRASAPAGSAHLRDYSDALHRFRTATRDNSDDKKDCPPPEKFWARGRT
jgi:hypothetical protein